MKKNASRALLWASTILSLVAPGVASAQATNDDEIVVTARRREERLQDVPLAVTAVSGETLERAQITDVMGLQAVAPSLVMAPGLGAGRNVPTFSIRGQSQQEANNITADPSVVIYVGDLVYARQQGVNSAMFDIDSVQVLKGPQGTLFGRNVTGGAILIRPNTPSDEVEGSVSASVGNFGTYDLQAMANLPLADGVSLRLAGFAHTSDGWLTDVMTGNEVNNEDRSAFRVSLRLEPSEKIESLFVYNNFSADDGMTGGRIFGIAPTTPGASNGGLGTNGPFDSDAARGPRNYPSLRSMLNAQNGRDFYETASGVLGFNKAATWDITNTSTFHATDAFSFKNIIGYREVQSHIWEDTDGLPIPLLQIERVDNFDQFSNEFQIFGKTELVDWIAGVFYFHENGRASGFSAQGAVDPGAVEFDNVFAYRNTAGAPAWAVTDVAGKNISYAVFAQGTFHLDALLDGMSVTLGARQNWDEREATFLSRTATACRFSRDLDNNPLTPETAAAAVPIAQCNLTLSEEFEEPTWNASLEYKFGESQLVYFAHRHGYRSGGFGARASTEQGLRRTFTPETVDDFEVGLKADWTPGDMFLRTNLAVYTSDYKDMQRFLTDPTTTPVTTVTVNAASATINGAEFEFTFRPNDYFELSGFYSYTDASFDKFITPAGVNLTNSPFARAPEGQYSVTARARLPIPAEQGEIWLAGSSYHNDAYNPSDDPNPARPFIQAYDLVNFNLDWSNVMGSDVDVGLFVKNALEEEYVLPYLEILALGFDARSPGAPRTYGVRLSYGFGGN